MYPVPEVPLSTDQSYDAKTWFTTAPTASQEAQEDTTSIHDVTYSSDGYACCGEKGN